MWILTTYEDYLANRNEYKQKKEELLKILSSKRQQKLRDQWVRMPTQALWDNLNETEEFVSLIESWKEDEFFNIIKKKYQKWLSDEVFNYEKIKKYAKDMIWDLYWYFASPKGFRSPEIDIYLETKMKEKWMTIQQITEYLCSYDIRKTIELYDFNLWEQYKKEFIDELIATIPDDYTK